MASSNYKKMQVAELQSLCEKRGLDFDGLSKAQLIELLEQSPEKEEVVHLRLREEENKKAELELKRLELEMERDREEREFRKWQIEREFELKKLQIESEVEISRQQAGNADAREDRTQSSHGRTGIGDVTTQVSRDSDALKLVPKLKDGDDVDAFLKTFERVASIEGWEQVTWARKLVPLLSGRAMTAYARIDVRDCKDYVAIKTAVLEEFHVNAEHYRVQFRTTKKRESESFKQWGVRLEEALLGWLQGEDATMDWEKLKQLMLLEQLFQSVPAALRIWLLDRRPKTLKEAAEWVDQYWCARQMEGGPGHPRMQLHPASRIKTREKPPSRTESDFSSKITATTHSYHTPKGVSEGVNKSRGPRARKCYRCGQFGHLSYTSREQKAEKPKGTPTAGEPSSVN